MFCVNLPINTNIFNNSQVRTFSQACYKATESIKSKFEAKCDNFDSEIFGKFNELASTRFKSYFDFTNILTITPNDYSSDSPTTYTWASITNPPVVTKFLAANKKELVDGMIKHLTTNIKETKRVVKQRVEHAVQALSDALDERSDPDDTIYEICSAQTLDVSDASSIDQVTQYESGEESIFDSAAPTSKHGFCMENTYNLLHISNPEMKVKPDIYKQPIVSQFIAMVEAKAASKQQNRKVFINDTAIFVCEFFTMVAKHQNLKTVSFYETSDFFRMIERDLESKAKEPVITMDHIWLKIYEILSNNSGDQDLQLFKLSQLEIRNSNNQFLKESLTEFTRTTESKKIPSHINTMNHPRWFRKSNYC